MRDGRKKHCLASVLLLGVVGLLNGCNLEKASNVSLRYRSERWLHRAELLGMEVANNKPSDGEAWLDVAELYGRALEELGPERIERSAPTKSESQLAKLTFRALLGRGECLSRAGEWPAARRDFEAVLRHAGPYPGARAQAALGLAQNEDRSGSWSTAYTAFQTWLAGVRNGEWPLDERGLDVPLYVSRRLSDRAQHDESARWVSEASETLETAALRDEYARDARYAGFVLLLHARRSEAALEALRATREIHDPEGRDAGLILAEANLLAGALQRPQEALGLLSDLQKGQREFDVEYRVAGSLLAAQIQVEAGNLDVSQAHYERAAAEARSATGRAEATLGLARVHVARGNIKMARRYYAQLREAYASTPAGLLGPLEEFRLLKENSMEVEARMLLSQAVHDYRRVISHFGAERPALRAASYLSECLGLAGSWERSVAFLDSIAEAFSTDPRAGSLLVHGARLAADQLGDYERASLLLRRVRERYPESDLAVAVRSLEDSLRQHDRPR